MSKPSVAQTTTEEKPRRRAFQEIRPIRLRGEKRLQVRVQWQGHRDSRTLPKGASREEARAARAELITQLKNRVTQEQQAEAAPATLATLCTAYALDLEARGKSPDSITRAQDTAKRLADFFGPRMQEPLALTETDLYAYRAHRLRQWAKRGRKAKDGTRPTLAGGVKAGTVNRDLRTIRAMLKRALPAFRFPAGVFLPENETRVKWLRPEDELMIFATMPKPFGDMARLAALTMMRLTEVRTLKREMVDLTQGVVILPRTKTEPRHVVLNQEAQGILQRALDAAKGEYLFPNPDGGPYSRVYVGRVWRKASRAAGLSDFHFHDLRHHGATMALNAGFTAPIVMALGGWKTEKMLRRYAAVTDKTLRAAAEATSGNAEWQRRSNPAPPLMPVHSSQG